MKLDTKQMLENTYNNYLDYTNKITKYLDKAPEGRLSMHRKGDKAYFYVKYIDEDGKLDAKYLKKKDLKLIGALAQKGYYKKLLTELEKRTLLLNRLLICWDKELDDIYDNLPEEYREYVEPINNTLGQKLEKWNREQLIEYNEYPDSLRFHTQRGEIVRSKSELMIANYLYKYKDVIDYKYEQELKLNDSGEEVAVHPDFKIINLKTGRIVYWEHAGKMDDIRYINGFMKKISLYSKNELMIGRDIIFTFEDNYHPLDSIQIRQAISTIMGDNEV